MQCLPWIYPKAGSISGTEIELEEVPGSEDWSTEVEGVREGEEQAGEQAGEGQGEQLQEEQLPGPVGGAEEPEEEGGGGEQDEGWPVEGAQGAGES